MDRNASAMYFRRVEAARHDPDLHPPGEDRVVHRPKPVEQVERQPTTTMILDMIAASCPG